MGGDENRPLYKTAMVLTGAIQMVGEYPFMGGNERPVEKTVEITYESKHVSHVLLRA